MESLPKAGVWESIQPSLNADVLKILREQGFEQMTPVQKAAIPMFLSNKDVCVEAVTGSGKTLAYVIPAIQMLLSAMSHRQHPWKLNEIGCIIISPTRELAKQIMDVLIMFLKSIVSLKACLLTGGVSQLSDLSELEVIQQQGCNIIVGTPGKLEHYITHQPPILQLKHLEVLILDEADRLLDMGFEATLNRILAKLPKQRRTGLFSATMNDQISELARAGLRNPVRISVHVELKRQQDSQKTPSNLHVYYDICEMEEKLPRFMAFLKAHLQEKIILYYATCACVDYFMKILSELSLPTKLFALHGKMEQKKRNAVFDSFTRAPSGLLLCTDVAARGLDIPDVDWVVQMDPPQDPKSFVHRCGRTARLGKEGHALVFLLPKEDTYIEFLKLRKIPMTLADHSIFGTEVQTTSAQEGKLLCKTIQNMALKDRDFYEKGLRAFVSFLRAYQEHQCHYIFRVKDLDLGRCATAYGLIHLPKMPELKNRKEFEHFAPLSVKVHEIPFKDKVREKHRQVKLRKQQEERNDDNKRKGLKRKPVDAWSKQKERKEKRFERKEKKERKRDAIERRKEEEEDDGSRNHNDMDELNKDASLLKKRKQGKLTELEFEKAMGLVDE